MIDMGDNSYVPNFHDKYFVFVKSARSITLIAILASNPFALAHKLFYIVLKPKDKRRI